MSTTDTLAVGDVDAEMNLASVLFARLETETARKMRTAMFER